MVCPDENTLSAWLRRELEEGARAQVQEHLGSCEACRALLEALVEGEPEARPPPFAADRAGPLRSGETLGRYVLLRTLGSGGFGTVYLAWDPQLDRRIALKVLRADLLTASEEHRQRFLREAQAMARLSHPNVTAVYDVAFLGGQASIAMELIDGWNAREWLAEAPRSWREVCHVFVQAGRGLEAAHAAGLVHRDFKPANVLIGRDGRVSVTDFGLARSPAPPSRAEEPAPTPSSTPERGADALTATGALLGTPAYMSPEQLAGLAVDARSDQFSFAVSLYEALFGEHPFLDSTAPHALAHAVQQGRRRPLPAKARHVPRAITRALLRALEPVPSRRFPDMGALLDEVSLEARRRRLRPVRLAATVALAALPVVAAYAWSASKDAMCRGAPARAASVWDEARKEQVRQAFLGTGAPFAAQAWRVTEETLDRWMGDWTATHTEACEATRIRGEQSDEVLTVRMLCLERALGEARALVEALSTADARTVGLAVNSVTALAPLDECRKVERLLLQEQPSERDAASVERVRGLLADARVLRNTGRREPSDALLGTALTEARRLQFAPLLAEALLQHGRASAMGGQTEQATQSLQEAVRAASRGRHDHAAAEALLDLLFIEGVVKHRDAALELRLPAVAALDRLGGDGALEARLASTTGLILARRGNWAEALEEQQRALRLMEQVYGREAVQVGSQFHKVAEMLQELGRSDEAEAHARRALTILERTYGAGHPMLASPLSVLAESACGRGRYAECLAQAEAALAVRATATTPPMHPAFLPKHLLIARALAGLGRHTEALERLKSAEHMARAAFPEEDAWRGRVDLTACEVLRRAGQREAALARCRQGLEILRKALGESHPEVEVARRVLEAGGPAGRGATAPPPRAPPPSSSAP